MHTIKTFSPQSTIASHDNLKEIRKFNETGFAPNDPTRPAFVTFAPYFPHLGTLTALEIVPKTGCAIAIYHPQRETYRYWEEEWKDSTEPIYQPVETIRLGLLEWDGPMQIEVCIEKEFFLLEMASEIGIDPFTCLFESALPTLFAYIPIKISFQTRSDAFGKIDLGRFSASRIQQITWREIGKSGKPQKATLEGGAIAVPPNLPVRVDIIFSCHTNYTYQEYQIQFLPCCVLNVMREENIYYPNTENPVALSEDSSLVIADGRISDRYIEARVFGDLAGETRAIAETLYAYLKREGKIYVSEFGCYFGIQLEGDIEFRTGAPYSYVFRICLPRIPGGTSDRFEPHPKAIDFVF